MYLRRMGWEQFMMKTYLTYAIVTYEFLSSFKFDEEANKLFLRLGNKSFDIRIFDLNKVLGFPSGHPANIEFNRDEFWREIIGQREMFYEPKSTKESKILSYALRYIHRLMAHTIFGRKGGDAVVTKIELTILFCMVNNIKLDICHAIALKLKDVATRYSSIIKIRRIVIAIAKYYEFDLSIWEYDKVKGIDMIGIPIMQSMGLIKHVNEN